MAKEVLTISATLKGKVSSEALVRRRVGIKAIIIGEVKAAKLPAAKTIAAVNLPTSLPWCSLHE